MRPCIRLRPFYREEMQNRAEKLGGIFMFVGGQGILSAPVCVRWRTGRFEFGHAGLGMEGRCYDS